VPWWVWRIALFAVSFLIGIVGVLAGVGGGVLFVPIVSGFFPFHLDFVRAAVGAPPGWGWLDLAARGDYLNYFGIVFLALVTGICYLRVLPMLFARERAYALIAAAEILVLAAAAAGIAGAAH
jgi:hypothetical protein